MFDLDELFTAAGPLARALPDFTPRPAQRRMASRIAAALEDRESLLVEAGTGTGKTFAYLVPALLSGRRVIISTGTRTLQDQLFAKDLPLVGAALGRPATVALLKGRANYLCRFRLDRAAAQLELAGFDASRGLMGRVESWARITKSGDLAEVPELSDNSALRPEITSTRDNCLGQKCRDFNTCHVVAARRAANEADVVIVNHHLLLADLALKEDGFGDILGSADAVILDEAHQLPDLATQFFGTHVSSRQIDHLIADVRTELAATGVAAENIKDAIVRIERASSELRSLLPVAPSQFAARGRTPPASAIATEDFVHALDVLSDMLEVLHAALASEAHEPSIAGCAARAARLAQSVVRIAHMSEAEGARTLESTAKGFACGVLPFDISERFRGIVESKPTAWIFTSATLSVGEDFSHFASRLGIAQAATLRIESPFDFERQALLYLPPAMPEPSSPQYVEAVIEVSLPLIQASGGGAFILFTSHRALGRAASLMREQFKSRLFVQGEAPREQLLRQFREHGDAVLLGTSSFWEGVDVKGDALRLVVIEKLPFASPDDPIVRARIGHLEATGGNAFRDYQLPEAALALKQGVGRLIRSEDDFGVVVLCDPRIVRRSYGRVFLASLPPFSRTRERDDATAFLHRYAPQRVRAALA